MKKVGKTLLHYGMIVAGIFSAAFGLKGFLLSSRFIDGGVTFAEGQYVPIAFSIWNGTDRERGNKRGLTRWMYLYTLPRETP